MGTATRPHLVAVGENPLPKKEEYHEDLTLPVLSFINRFKKIKKKEKF